MNDLVKCTHCNERRKDLKSVDGSFLAIQSPSTDLILALEVQFQEKKHAKGPSVLSSGYMCQYITKIR